MCSHAPQLLLIHNNYIQVCTLLVHALPVRSIVAQMNSCYSSTEEHFLILIVAVVTSRMKFNFRPHPLIQQPIKAFSSKLVAISVQTSSQVSVHQKVVPTKSLIISDLIIYFVNLSKHCLICDYIPFRTILVCILVFL